MWPLLLLDLMAMGAAGQERYALPRGTWRPIEVSISRDVEDGMPGPYLGIVLRFDPADENPEPDLTVSTYEDARQLFSRREWMLNSIVGVQLFDGNQDLGTHFNWRGTMWDPRICFRAPATTAETLQLILSQHEFVEAPFTARVTVPAPGADLAIGPLSFAFDRIEPCDHLFRYQEEMPDFRRVPGNWWYSRMGAPVERYSKLLFRMSAETDPDLTPYWFWSVTATVGERSVAARHAIMTHSTEPGVAWLGIWLPVAPERLPDTFDLAIEGEHLVVDQEASQESVFEIPMPALVR